MPVLSKSNARTVAADKAAPPLCGKHELNNLVANRCRPDGFSSGWYRGFGHITESQQLI
jgi:hypothetical protein